MVRGKNLEEFGVVISIAKRVGHARVCPTVRGATFSPRTWDQGSLCEGFDPTINKNSVRSRKNVKKKRKNKGVQHLTTEKRKFPAHRHTNHQEDPGQK